MRFDAQPTPEPNWSKPKVAKPDFDWLTDGKWLSLGYRERALLWAAYFADVVKPREVPMDSNRGEWVERFLRSAGVGPGNPWCASFVTWAYKMSGLEKVPKGPAAVYGWVHRSQGICERVTKPQRGDLFYWLDSRTHHGHIGFIVSINPLWINTIEGNAQPGDGGDQREGGGVYRRKRLRTPKIKFLRVL